MLIRDQIVAKMVGSKLQFPGWEDEGDGQMWARQMRRYLQARDADAMELSAEDSSYRPGDTSHVDTTAQLSSAGTAPPSRVTIRDDASDSDDSLEGYASESPSSSRTPSPPPLTGKEDALSSGKGKSIESFRPTIEEINKDPTLLNPLQKRIHKPVYLLDLGRLLKVDKEGNEKFESIQVALSTAASLIRKKANWGLELGERRGFEGAHADRASEENAVDLTHSLIGLQNNYEIEDFDEKVLNALTALVACSPRKAAL